jgi:hypothetical protein
MRCVAAGIWADDQLRLARVHADDFVRTQQILRQHALMLRTAGGAQARLLRAQAQRRRREKDAPGCERDAAPGDELLHSLTEAREMLAPQVEAIAARDAAARAAAVEAKVAAEAAAAAAKAAAAAAKAAAIAAARAAPRQVWPEPPPEPPPLTEAEQRQARWLIKADEYSTIFPMRARLIRRFGKLPDDCGIEQPEPELLEAIRTGNGFCQRWADELTPAEAFVNAGKDQYLCKYEEGGAEAVVPEPADSG